MIDLDELDRLHAEGRKHAVMLPHSSACVLDAYPALAAEIRVLREERDELARDVGALQEGDEIRALREVAAAAEAAWDAGDVQWNGSWVIPDFAMDRVDAALAKLKEVQGE